MLVAETAAGGLASFNARPPDLVLLDLTLPDGGGDDSGSTTAAPPATAATTSATASP